MEEDNKKSILLFDTPPEGVAELAERLGDASPAFVADLSKLGSEHKALVIQQDMPHPWHENVIGVIHPAHLAHPALEYLIRRTHSGEFSVDLNESFEEFEKVVHAYRFIDPFEEGEIGDAIAQKILDAGFDPLPFRTFHTALMGYVAHHVKRMNFLLPIDIQLGLFQGSVVVQCVVSAKMFTKEHLEESFGEKDINHPYKSLLKQCYESCHILDVAITENAQKVVMTGVWCHDQYGLPGGSFIYRNVYKLRHVVDRIQKSDQMHLIFGKHDSKFEELRFSGDTPRHFGPDEFIQTDHPYIVRMVVEHCSKVMEQTGASAPAEIEGIVRLLEDFQDKSLLSKLNARDWDNALKALHDTSTRELLEASVETIEGEVEEDIFERVVTTLQKMSFDEAKTVVSGKLEEDDFKRIVSGSEEEDDHETVISGTTEEIKEQRTMVRGQREDLGHGPTTVIKGGGGDPLAEKGKFNNRISSAWEDKKKGVLNTVRERWAIAKSNGSNKVDLENEMRIIMRDQLGLEDGVADQLVRGVVGESRDEVIAEKARGRAEEVKSRLQEEKFKQELAKRDQQILKMKKFMDQVKSELAKKNAPATTVVQEQVVDEDAAESQQLLQQEITRVSQELLKTNQEMAQLEREKDREIDNYQKQLEDLQKKVEFYKEKTDGEQGQKAQVYGLKRENESLQNQAQLQQSRVENMSQRMEKKLADIESRDRTELKAATERLANLESERQRNKDNLTRLEFMNKELEKKLLDKENELMRQRQSQSSSESSNNEEQLKLAIKEVEESRARERELMQESKAQQIKVRQLEQKLKFAQAQLDKQAARANGSNGGGAPSANEKRLETINKKLTDGMKSQAAEVAERKKEAIKLKAENNQLQHKLNELERQLAKFGKAS